ncbi:glycosyltransferase family 2 protein [Paremcibacter congregatus]|uniref:glycosyltransferase family 2 protein n=1 Tax=Paremcibacter congregatus TaxID=2043170 RepID=UPI003A8F3A94
MNNPITLITTVRNGDIFLDRFAKNIKASLRPQDRAIIVDDGSDRSVSLPAPLRNDDRVTLLIPGPVGRGAALNLAIENAPTDLIAIQDIDDLSLPGRLEHQSEFQSHNQDALIFTRATSDPWRPCFGRSRKIPAARLYLGNPLHHSSLALHRDVWRRAGGYPTDIPCCIDLEFYLRACLVGGASIWRLNDVLIERNLDPKTRHFAGIPAKTYHITRQQVLDRYHARVSQSYWLAFAKIRNILAGRKDHAS